MYAVYPGLQVNLHLFVVGSKLTVPLLIVTPSARRVVHVQVGPVDVDTKFVGHGMQLVKFAPDHVPAGHDVQTPLLGY